MQFQRLFRQRRLDKAREKQEEKEEEERRLLEERKRIGEFRSSMRKQLKLLESVPAREVNKFMVENQEQAITRIQAGYRGMVARRRATKQRNEVKQQRAAVTIQRQVRACVYCMYVRVALRACANDFVRVVPPRVHAWVIACIFSLVIACMFFRACACVHIFRACACVHVFSRV